MFNPLKQFTCKDIENTFGIPKELTALFLDCESPILPYAIIKVYQKYFRTPSFNELLDEDELAEYLLDEDMKFLPLRENEIRMRDNSMYDLLIEKGDIIRYSDCDNEETGLYVVELDGNTFVAYILDQRNGEFKFGFRHDDFESITLKSDKIKVLGYAEFYRKPGEASYRKISNETYPDLGDDFDE